MLNRTLAVALGVALVALGACKDNTSSTADISPEMLNMDIATAAGDATAEDVSLMATQDGALGAPTSAALRTGAWQANCTFDASAGRFSCPTLTHNGMTLTRSFQLLDASGTPQSAYDASTTATAKFSTTVAGSVSRDAFSATVSRQREMTLSGLAGAETQHTINGTGTESATRTRNTDGGVTRSYTMSHTVTLSNVVVPFPRNGGWPLSGTATRQIQGERDGARGTRTFSRTAVVTFNGTQFVPIVVNGVTYTLDLSTGKVQR